MWKLLRLLLTIFHYRCFYPKATFRLSSLSNIGRTNETSSLPPITAQLQQSDNTITLSINTVSDTPDRTKKQSQTNSSQDFESSEKNYEIQYHQSFGFNITRLQNIIFDLPPTNGLHVLKNFVSISISVSRYSKAYGLGNFDRLEKIFDGSTYTVSVIKIPSLLKY